MLREVQQNKFPYLAGVFYLCYGLCELNMFSLFWLRLCWLAFAAFLLIYLWNIEKIQKEVHLGKNNYLLAIYCIGTALGFLLLFGHQFMLRTFVFLLHIGIYMAILGYCIALEVLARGRLAM